MNGLKDSRKNPCKILLGISLKLLNHGMGFEIAVSIPTFEVGGNGGLKYILFS